MIYSSYLPVDVGITIILLEVKTDEDLPGCDIVLVRGSEGVMVVGRGIAILSVEVKAKKKLS